MKKSLKMSSIVLTSLLFLGSSLNAQTCINSKSIDVKWTSFKTFSKVGVSGHFNNVDLKIKNKNASTVKLLLEGANVNISLDNIDANSAIKTSNIKKYFVSNLKSKNIMAKISSVYDNSLDVSISLNGVSHTIPMKYSYTNNKIMANGTLDGRDFKLVNGLKILNSNVAGHLNKGWLDIPIKFEINTTNVCM